MFIDYIMLMECKRQNSKEQRLDSLRHAHNREHSLQKLV